MIGRDTSHLALRWGSNLAVACGICGILAGLLGVSTFIPARSLHGFGLAEAQTLTEISVVGTAFSVASVWAGRRLRSGRGSSILPALTAALGSVASLCAMGVVWPSSWTFVGIVASFYGVEILLLRLGRTPDQGAA